MLLATKIGWAGIALTFVTIGIQGFPRSAAGSDSNKAGVATFVVKNEIKKMQETLRDRGQYRGKVDGVFGLRTRASIRAYQKAEKLPITGQVDSRTADGLRVRPESTWGNSKSAEREVGHDGDGASAEMKRDKPSAGIRRVERRAGNISRKEVSKAVAVEANRGGGVAKKRQSEDEEHDR